MNTTIHVLIVRLSDLQRLRLRIELKTCELVAGQNNQNTTSDPPISVRHSYIYLILIAIGCNMLPFSKFNLTENWDFYFTIVLGNRILNKIINDTDITYSRDQLNHRTKIHIGIY